MKTREFNRSTKMLAQRPWTERERRIVWCGLTGRMAIAIEPLIGMAFFSFLTWGIVWRAHHVPDDATLVVIAPIFALGALAFLGYFIAVTIAPFIAYLQTYKPIYIVDGYVRYRGRDERSENEATGYMATLCADGSVACEWECFGNDELPSRTIPALAEFSEYAGIHKIDGKPTGLLPDVELPLLAIGIAPRNDRS